MRFRNWMPLIALALFAAAWSLGQAQQPVPEPQPGASAPAAKPVDTRAGQADKTAPARPEGMFP
ncbi:MAG: hypothetical protein H6Q06_2467, partial [Acidobacteria bacterium]|nr:hypothetical protein [Acidobacteriota bacterium]